MHCLLSTRYTMTAEVLRTSAGTPDVDMGETGSWHMKQDPESGEFVPVWVPLVEDSDDPTPKKIEIPCQVRGIVDGGIRVAGTTERFGTEYENVDFVKMTFGPDFVLTKRDQITNIKDARTGRVIWVEEEIDKVNGVFRPTVFNVNGVTPEPDPFGRVVSQFALLSRARNV